MSTFEQNTLTEYLGHQIICENMLIYFKLKAVEQ